MPRRAVALDCSAEERANLVAASKSRTQEARPVERARMVLACLDGQEIQQVARVLGVSIPSVSQGRARFSQRGRKGLRDDARPGKAARAGTPFRDRVLGWLEQPPPTGRSARGRAGYGDPTRFQPACGLARSAPGRDLSTAAAQGVPEQRGGVRAEGRCRRGPVSAPRRSMRWG
jgi:Homeodomain-like domain